ncbi:uncharacterized protein GGS25DRAFT_505169 [Hypoxylon fragiforme]|uniref:uncharacterized protein n=1 Tax=Hypoxylon fragiforme TaxID=63214 RepID=UPI0020C671D1|nr:uncharacterized protein GGS25DRAFT_505169 [Hypoxylon fragiforme]KAI2605457.1 hypothetical protein GGS25DRAFT_505169 [Hypoxylon fragiforme]
MNMLPILNPRYNNAPIHSIHNRRLIQFGNMAGNMAPIQTVPKEVLADIIRLVCDSSPQTASSLLTVNPIFHDLTLYALHRNQTFNPPTLLPALERIDRSNRWRAIRAINLESCDWLDVSSGAICDALSKTTGLRDIRLEFCRAHFQSGLFDALSKRPHLRIHLKLDGTNPFANSESIQLLNGNLNLVSLDVVHEPTLAVDCIRVTKPLRDVLLTCLNLRHLRLCISMASLRREEQRQDLGFGFRSGERPPALESLEILDYSWRGHLRLGDGSHVIPNRQDNEELYWAQSFDWSRMTKLRAHDVKYLARPIRTWTSLKEVQITSPFEARRATRSFFLQVPSFLESIKVGSLRTIGLQGLHRHGESLRVLHLHEDLFGKCQSPTWSKSAIHTKGLRVIRDNCPHLEELKIDVYRANALADGLSDVLATFRHLRSVTVCFSLVEEHGEVHNLSSRPFSVIPGTYFKMEKLAFPFVTFSSTVRLFGHILAGPGRLTPSSLKQLTAVVGGPLLQPRIASPDYLRWVDENTTSFTCKISDRDDARDSWRSCLMTAACPELTDEENAILQKAATTHEDLLHLVKKSPDGFRRVSKKFKLAEYGPTQPFHWPLRYDEGCIVRGGVRFYRERSSEMDVIIENEEEYVSWKCLQDKDDTRSGSAAESEPTQAQQ